MTVYVWYSAPQAGGSTGRVAPGGPHDKHGMTI